MSEESRPEPNRTRAKAGNSASKKQRRANRNKAKWSYAELHGYIDYKANLKGSLAQILQRFSELRWSSDTSPHQTAVLRLMMGS